MVKNKFKTIRTLRFILSFLILHLFSAGGLFTANATVHYVSHEGSNTPPYLTWETAADSIMSAINISVFGDTIYVANGVYEEQVTMIPGLTLIGAGMDSCVIDTRKLVYSGIRTVEILDSCTIKGFKLFVGPLLGPRFGTAVFMSDTTFDCVIESNYMFSAAQGVWATDCTIKRNIISNVKWGISFGSSLNFIDTFKVFIDSNFISFSNDGIFSHNSIIPQEMLCQGQRFLF